MPRSNPIDVHVGLRIRQRRVLLGMNMWNLGVAVGLSFQMIQKYEAGFCCIPVSRLFELANALDVSPSFFFEGPRPRAMDDSLYTRETMDLVNGHHAEKTFGHRNMEKLRNGWSTRLRGSIRWRFSSRSSLEQRANAHFENKDQPCIVSCSG
jgi:transcriptional regulator with XRE-family HTH domain